MKNRTRPARALAALTSGWSSVDVFDGGKVDFIGRQNSNARGWCHGNRIVYVSRSRRLIRDLATHQGRSAMVFVLGTDEAGYGPNLGPLCIGASAWELPDDAPADGLYNRLAAVVCAGPEEGCQRLAIADSKMLYKSGGTLELLERGVLTLLACLDRLPRKWRTIWRALDGEALAQIDGAPWHDGFDEDLPLHTLADELRAGAMDLLDGCCSAKVKIVELQAAVLFPWAFNAAVTDCGNKA